MGLGSRTSSWASGLRRNSTLEDRYHETRKGGRTTGQRDRDAAAPVKVTTDRNAIFGDASVVLAQALHGKGITQSVSEE